MALILPKGIVVNTPEIGGDIEKIRAEPLDPAEIAKFWKVYTTTSRRLLDPTAERLENYWWRIWGSQRRELNGATIARLFALISDGQSFVPLRSPANRDEGTSPPLQRTSRHSPGASSAINFQHATSSRPSTTSSSIASRAPAVMPHPILKKTRGPTASGPKPTARFISPHDSEVEVGDPVSPNAHVVVQPPSPVSQDPKIDKKLTANGNGKKQTHVASSSVKKKRPVIVRRKSSQSSNDNASKAADGHEYQPSSSGRTPPSFRESSEQKEKSGSQSKFQENFSPSPEKSPKKRSSSKSTESRRSTSRKSSSGTRREESRQGSVTEIGSNGDPGPSTLRAVENQQPHLTEDELEELEVQRIILAQANAKIQGTHQAPAQAVRDANKGGPNLRASHRSASEGHLGMGANRYLPHDSKGAPSLAPTLADATGELNLGSTGLNRPPTPSGTVSKGKGRASGEAPRTADMFAKQPIQQIQGTILVPPEIPGTLAKSKSQLTLLLEKDRQRSSEHKPKDDKKKGKKG